MEGYRNQRLPRAAIPVAFSNGGLDKIPKHMGSVGKYSCLFRSREGRGFSRWAWSIVHDVRNIACQYARRISSTSRWPNCLSDVAALLTATGRIGDDDVSIAAADMSPDDSDIGQSI